MQFTADRWNKEQWPNFSFNEVKCTHCGACDIDEQMMDSLQGLRQALGFPLTMTSVYRCPRHPNEVSKERPGTHTMGKACDIACSHTEAFLILSRADAHGFTGIGISQKGDPSKRFIHLDIANEADLDQRAPRPTVWSY
jgi:zinc D-Ala-D-Ala carboxypeptidase